jgi:hypothetical protein
MKGWIIPDLVRRNLTILWNLVCSFFWFAESYSEIRTFNLILRRTGNLQLHLFGWSVKDWNMPRPARRTRANGGSRARARAVAWRSNMLKLPPLLTSLLVSRRRACTAGRRMEGPSRAAARRCKKGLADGLCGRVRASIGWRWWRTRALVGRGGAGEADFWPALVARRARALAVDGAGVTGRPMGEGDSSSVWGASLSWSGVDPTRARARELRSSWMRAEQMGQ